MLLFFCFNPSDTCGEAFRGMKIAKTLAVVTKTLIMILLKHEVEPDMKQSSEVRLFEDLKKSGMMMLKMETTALICLFYENLETLTISQ